MKKIVPFLWFNDKAEEAAKFYVSIFKNSKIIEVSRYPKGPYGKAGSVMTVDLTVDGQELLFLNGGPVFKINEAFSLVVHCKNQKEIDKYWNKLLSGGGKPVQCGWLKDKFGVSWQIVPTILYRLMRSKDPERTKRVNAAMLKMIKFDIQKLKDSARAS